MNFEELRTGERVKNDEYAKESVADFALWKARTPDDGEVAWPSPFGEGRPGWHIECSAMSMQILGQSFDLHLGGEDLIFPHHEDEIAQSEGATGKPFAKYWLHGAHLLVEGKKMSKSLGNFFTLRDLLQKGFTGREIRCLLLSAHYRETFNFTMDGLQGQKMALSRIDECLGKLREIAGVGFSLAPTGGEGRGEGATSNAPTPLDELSTTTLQHFSEALDEDLNVSAAWGVVFDWVSKLNRRIVENSLAAKDAASALAIWAKMDSVLGVGTKSDVEIPAEISALPRRAPGRAQRKEF